MSRYKPYPQYKESGVEWVGSYPKGWTITRVKFDSYVKARVGWHGLKSDDFTDEGPYLVTGSDFKGPEIRWENCYHCDLARYEQDPYIQLNEEDLLITKDGTIGKVALVRGLDGKATLNSGVFVVRPLRNKYTTKYYFWLLQSNVFDGFVDFNKTGSTIVHLYQDTFVNFKYAMPTYSEQLAIAHFLDHETAKIDALIEKQQRLIELLKEKRQAVISHAVTKGLNPNAPMKDSGVEWLGEVPAHWEVLPIKYLSDSIGTGGTPKSELSFAEEPEIFWFTPGDFSIQGQLISSAKHIANRAVANGDAKAFRAGSVLIIGIGATLGKVALCESDFSCNQQINVVTPNPKVKADFLMNSLLVQAEQMKQSSNFSTIGIMNQEKTKQLVIAVPPLDEQAAVARFLDEKKVKFDAIEAQALNQIALLQERRTALISAAVTGKIDVRDWQAAA